MAKKKSRSLSDSFLIKYFNQLVIVFAILNLIVIVLFERDRQPQIVRSFETIQTNHVIVVTNYIESVKSYEHSELINNLDQVTNSIYNIVVSYDFFTAQGRIYVNLFGEYLTFGSPTSYGRLVDIYPDRLFTDRNFVLVNRKYGEFKNER